MGVVGAGGITGVGDHSQLVQPALVLRPNSSRYGPVYRRSMRS
jgi:hypothetical protein